jgi:hypothetical protein
MLAVLFGLLFVIAGMSGLIFWWFDFVTVMKGLLPPLLMGGGFLAVVAGFTSIRDARARAAALKDHEQH